MKAETKQRLIKETEILIIERQKQNKSIKFLTEILNKWK